jgi:hypothetical protein
MECHGLTENNSYGEKRANRNWCFNRRLPGNALIYRLLSHLRATRMLG